MKRTVRVMSIVLILLAVSVTAQTISTQGVLRDNDGHSVADGDYNMSFTIFGSLDGSDQLWGPEVMTVAVENGIYQVVLGENNPIITFNTDGSNFLEIAVESETMTPRLRLNVSAYELANLSGASNVLPGSGNVGVGTTNPQSKVTIVAPGDNVDLLQFDEDGDDLKEFTIQGMFAGTSNTGNGLKLRSQWIDNIMFWRGDGKVGIGTQEPTRELTVEGSIQASNWIGNAGDDMGQDLELGNEELTTHRFDADNFRIYAGGSGGVGTVLTASESGKVGIGTANPAQKLHVVGGTDVNTETGGFIQLGDTDSDNIGIDNNEIMARNNGEASSLYINSNGGNINLGGPINTRVGTSTTLNRPFQFRKFTATGENAVINTGWSSTDWILAVTGIDAGYGDLDESGNNDLWQFNGYVEDGVWKIYCDAPTHDNYPEWDVYVMFVNTKFGYADSGYKSN